ncbi:unnamed protein product [Arctogadus glacialis]
MLCLVRYFPYTALLSIRLDTPPPLSLLSASPPHHGLSFEVPVPTSLPSLGPSFVSLFRPLPRGYTGTMEATTLVLLVLLDCLLVSSSRPFRSSSAFLVVKSAIQEHAIAAQSPRGEECYPGARARGLVARWNQEEAGLHRSRRVSTHPLPPPHSKCTNDPAAPHYEHEDIR